MAIGAITNIAQAIKIEPKIINKIEVVWLGGNDLNCKNNMEYNFRQDVEAVKIVFDSNVKLTVIPCKSVASILYMDINTLKNGLKNNNLNNYLVQRFYNDEYHEPEDTRIIWDIAVVAYILHKEWFETKEVLCPQINEDTSYQLTDNKHKITFVTQIDRAKVYEDLFKRLNDKI